MEKKVDGYNLEVGNVESASVLSFKEESTGGEVANAPVSGNMVRVNVGEFPKIVMVKEKQ